MNSESITPRRRILIGCPYYKMYVGGSYECDTAGRYLLRDDDSFNIDRAKCGQRGGRCQQRLCYLHRFNNGGPGTWYPTDILSFRDGEDTPEYPEANAPSPQQNHGLVQPHPEEGLF